MDLSRLCELILGRCPGRGKIAFRVAPDDQYPHLLSLTSTRRGTIVKCRSDAVLRKARRLITPQTLPAIRRSVRRASEVLSALGPLSFVHVGGEFYTTPDLFRPCCAHRVWRLEPAGAGLPPGTDGPAPEQLYAVLADWSARAAGEGREDWRVVARGKLFVRPRNEELAYVASLYTEPDSRRQGMAKSVASSITADILSSGKQPLYLCELDNRASVGVCGSLGYRLLATSVCANA